jgi:hypothetical protein
LGQIVLLRLCLLLLLAFNAPAAVLTFDDLTGMGSMPVGYGGIGWNSGWSYFDSFQPPYTPTSGNTRIYNNDGDHLLTFSFLMPNARLIGAWFSGYLGAQWQLYDDGNLVHTSERILLSDAPAFLAAGYSGPVDEVTILATSERFVMDDLTFEQSGVPEPGSMMLVATGVGALLLHAKVVRHRKSIRTHVSRM